MSLYKEKVVYELIVHFTKREAPLDVNVVSLSSEFTRRVGLTTLSSTKLIFMNGLLARKQYSIKKKL